MSVGRDYMLRKEGGRSAPKLFLDTKVVPRLVDAAGRAEVVLDRAARATGVRPSLLLAGAGVALSVAAARAFGLIGSSRSAWQPRGERSDAAGHAPAA